MKAFRVLITCAIALMLFSSAASAAEASLEKKVYDDFKSSLVAVKYTWVSELGNQEWTAPGVIVSDDGLVMFPINIVTPQFVPDGQMKSFKIVVPSDTEDETEIDADFQGRDTRSDVAFVKASTPQKWKAIHFVDVPVDFGDQVYSIGMLPRVAGYKSFVTSAIATTRFRGPTPQILVDGTLASPGGVVFNTKEEAVGYIFPRELIEGFLNNPRDPNDMSAIYSPKKTFVPTSFFLKSLNDPPKPDQRIDLSWMGCNMKGVDKDFAEFFGLKNKPSIQVTDVVPDSPAEKAGLKAADIIIKMNGQPLERGDLPEELPSILTRTLQWMKPGTTVTFTVIHQKDDKPKDISITMESRPLEAYEAHRFWASDMGFVARDVVFDDTNLRKLKRNTGGVVVALTKPGGAASTAKLQKDDLVTQLNGKPVTDLDQFKKDYQQFRKDKPQDPVVLVVSQSDGKEQTINIEPPQNGVVPGANTDQ